LTDPSTKCANSSGQTVSCTAGIDSGNPNTYFLHDWPATSPGTPQPPSGDHATHPTVGTITGLVCTALIVSGCPVPDLMDTSPPSGDTTTHVYNYASDQATGGYLGGRLLQPSCADTCLSTSGGGTGSTSDCNGGGWTSKLLNVRSEFWVSSPLTATTTFTGDGGINIFTQTLGGVAAIVSFCVEIYDVPPSGTAGSLANLLAWPPVDLGGAAYVPEVVSSANWPSIASQLSFVFNFRGSSGAVSIAAGHRLGVRIWAKVNTNTPIAVIYDNPSYPAQVQLNSQ